MKKKFNFAPLLAAALVLSSCICIFAADSPAISVSLSAQSIQAGETFTAAVRADGLNEVKSIMISPRYDTDRLELVSSRWLTADAFLSSAEPPAIAVFEKNTAISGEIFSCTFRVKSGVSGDTEISFDVSARTKPDGSPETVLPVPIVKSASLSIVRSDSQDSRIPDTDTPPQTDDRDSAIHGDVTGDGRVNAADLVRLMKYISGAPTEIYGGEANADINTDGKVNSKDLTRLMKMIAES